LGIGDWGICSWHSRVESRESGVESRESGVESRESGVESRESRVVSRRERQHVGCVIFPAVLTIQRADARIADHGHADDAFRARRCDAAQPRRKARHGEAASTIVGDIDP
jgi:hypothetical protein